MTTNKPHIEAYLVTRIKNEGYGKPRRILDAEIYDPTSGSFFVSGAKENHTVEPLVPLSDYEALQAECEKLRRDVGSYVDVLTGALERVKIADDEPMHHARHGSAYWNNAVTACICAVISAHRKGGDQS